MEDYELYAIAGMSSSSPAMFERRRRILTEARRLIGRGQADGFSVRELCEIADVAPNTLYNAFGSKENVAALAIAQYLEDFYSALEFEHAPDTFDGVVEREVVTTIRNLSIPHYVRGVASLYFSSTSAPLRSALVGIATKPYRPWLERMRMARQLARGVAIERAERNLAALLFAQVHEWRAGELEDATVLPTRLDAILSYCMGITSGEARKAVRLLFVDVHGPGTHIELLTQKAREKLGVTAALHL